jgi:DNA-directed RNA polymerase subunit K/omega
MPRQSKSLVVAPPVRKKVAKKKVATKTSAKKTSAKKTSAKKTSAKKTSAKKTSAKPRTFEAASSDDEEYSDVEPELTEDLLIEPLRLKYTPLTHLIVVTVHDDNRVTPDILSVNELAEVTSIRASQIERGGPHYATVKPGMALDPISIAHAEIAQKQCPLSVKRHLTDALCEVWAVNDLTVLEPGGRRRQF